MTRFCTQCGQSVADGVRFCTNCGAPIAVEQTNYAQPDPQPQQPYNPQPEPQPYQQPYQQQPMGVKPKSFLVLSILATIFCCLPFGIIAIVQSAKVDNLWNAGQYVEAQTASRKARNWVIVSAAIGIVGSILYVILVAMGAVASYY